MENVLGRREEMPNQIELKYYWFLEGVEWLGEIAKYLRLYEEIREDERLSSV